MRLLDARLMFLLFSILLCGCAATPGGSAPAAPPAWITIAPGLRINTELGIVEFDGVVASDCHNPATPDVYLELLVCAPDTREHEALVVTTVQPSLIHAALLAIGAVPGSPGNLGESSPPSGSGLTVEVIVRQGEAVDVRDWVTDAPTRSLRPMDGFVFSGSQIHTRENATRYDADGTGVIIGLTTFGSEVVAYRALMSPQAAVDEPVWIADPQVVPEIGAEVRVRIRLGVLAVSGSQSRFGFHHVTRRSGEK